MAAQHRHFPEYGSRGKAGQSLGLFACQRKHDIDGATVGDVQAVAGRAHGEHRSG